MKVPSEAFWNYVDTLVGPFLREQAVDLRHAVCVVEFGVYLDAFSEGTIPTKLKLQTLRGLLKTIAPGPFYKKVQDQHRLALRSREILCVAFFKGDSTGATPAVVASYGYEEPATETTPEFPRSGSGRGKSN